MTDMPDVMDELDQEQRDAVNTDSNAVVSAGAGSGKTRVLAARYGRFILDGVCTVDKILTITFTNKAANEMYDRIYKLLAAAAPANERAREALDNFHNASIFTLDHFCAMVARSASRYFGISAAFTSDEGAVRDLARALALRFVLDNRNNSALQQLIAEHKIREVADNLFANPLLAHSPVSRPCDFDRFEMLQKNELLAQWRKKTGELSSLLDEMRERCTGTKLFQLLEPLMEQRPKIPALENLFNENPPLQNQPRKVRPQKAPLQKDLFQEEQTDMAQTETDQSDPSSGNDNEKLRGEISQFFDFVSRLCALPIRKSGSENESYQIVQRHFRKIKDQLWKELEAIANPCLQWNTVRGVFPLIAEYQAALNQKKREAGILTFTDIAHLAVDALIRYPGIRAMYKNRYKKIMIDEFQDNNSLQRDLVYLLAEKDDHCAKGVPLSGALCPGKIFFVGDEKQSIYRFRGADVSVFRSLSRDIGADHGGVNINLGKNYRSHPDLVKNFNSIFGGLLSKDDPCPLEDAVFKPEKGIADYEASYRWIEWIEGGKTWGGGKRLHFAFFDEDRIPENSNRNPPDYESDYTARTIQELVRAGAPVRDKKTKLLRPCTYGDIAVLQRSYTNQHSLEKSFKNFSIPFFTDRPAAMLHDAPVNDMWNLLKLIVYPNDRIAYAALLASPFVRLSGEALTICMLSKNNPVPFDRTPEDRFQDVDLFRYRAGRRLYEELCRDARDLPVSALITKLWYEKGYRFETLWFQKYQAYGSLYDLFFETARTVEKQGKGLVDFLDHLEMLLSREERPDDLELPGEEDSGVRILSIHRCKGLEFPVVFLYGCGSAENTRNRSELALYTERWGLVPALPPAEELVIGGNYFFDAEKEEDRLKTSAELRRLLYVAMTRAESRLFVSARMSRQNNDEKKELPPESMDPMDYFYERYNQFRSKKVKSISFFRLLPPLVSDDQLYTFEQIFETAGPGADSAENLKTSVAALRTTYENIPASPDLPARVLHYAASSLHVDSANANISPRADANTAELNGKIDTLLESAGIRAEEFGTFVHSFIEERFKGLAPDIPPELAGRLGAGQAEQLLETAAALAEGFFASALGGMAGGAAWRKNEFRFVTMVQRPGPEQEQKVTISGSMDLVFEADGVIHVVDFKTDHVEDITRHLGQLAVYRRAAADIFLTPRICCWLFYLRGGVEYDLTEAVKASAVELLV
ncbi:MAG: UvrD-helicase domain-containing protein [Treponema sp.]|nr:UvrD-helicase domain-containing protein [Treponema sp.]